MSSSITTTDESQPEALDRMVHVAIGHVTQGISPTSVMLAYLDWLVHLQSSPGKWMQLSSSCDGS